MTTNVVESSFAAVRLRTSAAKRFKNVGHGTAIIWRLLRIAVKRFRKLNAPERTFTHFLKRHPDCGEGQVEFLNRRVDFDRLPSWLPAAMRPLHVALDTSLE